MGKKANKCVICGITTSQLTIHHKDGNQQNNGATNLITLCYGCHEKLPVDPLHESFYCKTIIHRDSKPVCLRFNFEGYDMSNCPHYSPRYGCLLAINFVENKPSLKTS